MWALSCDRAVQNYDLFKIVLGSRNSPCKLSFLTILSSPRAEHARAVTVAFPYYIWVSFFTYMCLGPSCTVFYSAPANYRVVHLVIFYWYWYWYWYCMVFYCTALYCIVLYGILCYPYACYCVVGFGARALSHKTPIYLICLKWLGKKRPQIRIPRSPPHESKHKRRNSNSAWNALPTSSGQCVQ